MPRFSITIVWPAAPDSVSIRNDSAVETISLPIQMHRMGGDIPGVFQKTLRGRGGGRGTFISLAHVLDFVVY